MLPLKYWNKTNLVLFFIIFFIFIISIMIVYNMSLNIEQLI